MVRQNICEDCGREFPSFRGKQIHRASSHRLSECKFCHEFVYGLSFHVVMCKSNPNRDVTIAKIAAKNSGITWNNEQRSRLKRRIEEKIQDGTWHNSFSKRRIHEYRGEKLDGTWELKLAMWFDEHGITWERNKRRFPYHFDGKDRWYTPDFYIPAADCYVEVKGWRVPKDEAKWKQFPHTLLTLSGADLHRLGIDVGPYRDWRK